MTGADMYPDGSLQLLRTSVRARLTTMDDVALEIVRGDADIVAGDRWFLIYDGTPVPCKLEWAIEREPGYPVAPLDGQLDVLALRVRAVAGEASLGAICRIPMKGRLTRWPTVWATLT